jgi:hypothetical protein
MGGPWMVTPKVPKHASWNMPTAYAYTKGTKGVWCLMNMYMHGIALSPAIHCENIADLIKKSVNFGEKHIWFEENM